VGITNNAPLRRGKGSPYEGGHRVPLIIRLPRVIDAGRESSEVVTSVDYYPTILAATGVEGAAAHNASVDGRNLLPILERQAALERDAVYWHYPHYHAGGHSPYGAVRAGDWKLIEFYEDGRLELYNLRDDIGETKNLAQALPERTGKLQRRLANWRKSVGAQMPTANPYYDPQRARRFGGNRPKKKASSKPGPR